MSIVTLIAMAMALQGSQMRAWFPFERDGVTLYLKWGDNRAHSGVSMVSWSLVPAGTPGDSAFCGSACPGLSHDAIQLERGPGLGFESRSLDEIVPIIQGALDEWSSSSGIRFVQVEDSALPMNAAGADEQGGQIRFAVFAFQTSGAAVGYAPPPNGGTGAGDVLLNANAFYQVAPGSEGAEFDIRFAPNDLPGLLLHEIGHALGLAHPAFDGSCPVMQVEPTCQGRINRKTDADDIASILFLYGPRFADGFESGP